MNGLRGSGGPRTIRARRSAGVPAARRIAAGAEPARDRGRSLPPRSGALSLGSAQELEDALGLLVGEGQDRGAGGVEDLGAGEGAGFGGEVGVDDGGLGGGEVLEGGLEGALVGLEDVALEGAEASAEDGDLVDGGVEDVLGVGEVAGLDVLLDGVALPLLQGGEELERAVDEGAAEA